jgi:alkylation response protein AidB-like acyl-CoA dehydrogenase
MSVDAELEEVRELVARFAHDVVRPRASAIDLEDTFPRDVWEQACAIGLPGMSIPVEHGGAGMSHHAMMVALEELATASATVANILMVQTCYADFLVKYAPAEMRDAWVPRILAGEVLIAIGITEPDTGSDVRAIRTTARRDGDEWVIDGTKQWITLAGDCDVVITFCRSAEHEGGFELLLVEADRPGFQRAELADLLGMRGESTGGLVYDGVRVPASNHIGVDGKGLGVLLGSLDYGRLAIAALALGLGRRAMEESISYANARHAFGRPIGDYQGVSFKIADMQASLMAARAVTHRGADLMDAGLPCAMEASVAKLLASEAAMAAASEAVLIHGGMGYSKELPLERLYREAKLTQIYEGTNYIQRMIISRTLLAAG